MVGRMNTYADFAENDYNFFRQAYDNGNKGAALASLGQSICERYLKHLISEYAQPENELEFSEKESILRTHSLRRLMRYISENMKLDIPEQAENSMERIDGFYFTTRYPGDDSFIPNEKDIDRAEEAVRICRNYVKETEKYFDQAG